MVERAHDSTPSAPPPSSGLRAELGRLAALVGVAGVAVTQPLLDTFGESPETFIFRQVSGTDLVLFALAVALLPPVVVWWVGVLVGFWAPRYRLVVHGASVALFVAFAVVQAVSSWARPPAIGLALAVALVAWVLTARTGAFRLWCQLLAGLSVVALAAFLLLSPASDLLASDGFEAAASTDAPAASVVVIVVDELPTASIVDERGAIDEVRFPNLARLAAQATWYRNHTTQSGFTETAVPALLTGKAPQQVAPLFTNHPDNLFRLLAGSHDLVVSESMTRLCPASVCGDAPKAPVTGEDDTGEDPVEDDDDGAALGELFGDALDVWIDRISGTASAVSFGAFEEEVEEEPVVEAPAASAFGAGEQPGDRDTWQEAVATQPSRLTEFLAALRPGDRPMAAVLHLVSPHWPWRYLPDGTEYAEPAEGADLPINGGGDPWVANLERQRHLLQAGYTDRLVGQILEQLDASGAYDDAAIVITADHGIAFHGDPNRRLPSPEAMPELMWTPLIVKAPRQVEPRVDDTNVQSTDVLPTLAALIGVDIPWEVDGLDANGDEAAARGDTKRFRRFETDADPNPWSDVEVDGAAGFQQMLDLWFPPIAPDAEPVSALYGLSGRGDLVGQAYEPTTEGGASVDVDELDRLLGEDRPVLVLTGTVADGGQGEHVVAAVDEQIVAVSPVVRRNAGGRAFALLLPSARPIDVAAVRLGIVTADGLIDTGALGD